METNILTEELYASYKSLLFSLAYRMLGSVMDAEDLVHEAFLSLQGTEPGHVANVKAYLCKTVTNRCIDRLRSSQKQRERYVGPWLPEPLVAEWPEAGGAAGGAAGGIGIDPYQAYTRREAVSTAYLLLLQQLSWTERAVFLLREVLQYEYDEIAGIVGKSAANCRQIFHRARRAIHPEDEAKAPGQALPGHQALVEQFAAALASGDVGRLLNVLSRDAALLSDGGGKVHAAVRPIVGAARVAGFLEGVLRKLGPGHTAKPALVGGELGLVTYTAEGVVSGVASFRVEQDRIAEIYILVNPDKLARVR
ncbi:RNA polymerase sigma factor SigJ [Paenibacillus sp. GCM10023250]|uniref:RNA polymerase sigma factor SigJ n=1 Tax=Paenibacillus sp. GCM10023250 TaxID=3252648 RepID=UPI0036154403